MTKGDLPVDVVKPPRLREGDVVGIAAPAHPYYPGMGGFVKLGCDAITHLGLRVEFGRNALSQRNQIAIPAQKRADDLNELFSDPSIKAIFCLSGGANTNAILPLLDWDAITLNPKIIMRFSANSALLLGIYSQTRMVCFHGPHVVLDGLSEYPEPFEYTLHHLQRLLFHDVAIGTLRPPKLWTTDFPRVDQRRQMKTHEGWFWLRQGTAEGRLLGGNLAAMRTIAGTRFFPSFESAILFAEEVYMGSSILKDIDDSLAHLRLLGVFDQISGLIFGKINDQTEEEEEVLAGLILEHTREYSFPVLIGVDIGHTDPKVTLPLGVRTLLDSYADVFSLEESAVSRNDTR